MTVAASRLLPVPIGHLQVGQLFLLAWLSCHCFKQGEQTKCPRGQQGTGPSSLGSVLHIEHSTRLSCSAAILLSFETSASKSSKRLFVLLGILSMAKEVKQENSCRSESSNK